MNASSFDVVGFASMALRSILSTRVAAPSPPADVATCLRQEPGYLFSVKSLHFKQFRPKRRSASELECKSDEIKRVMLLECSFAKVVLLSVVVST